MKTYLKKVGVGFYPADAEEEEKVRSMKDTEIYRAELKRPRSYPNHKHMMAILNYVVNNSDGFNSIEKLLVQLKIECDHYDEHIRSDGQLIFVPKSINFDSMEEEEFKSIKKKFIDVCLDKFLPGNTQEERDQHFMNIWRIAS